MRLLAASLVVLALSISCRGGPAPATAASVPYDLYTHCGVVYVDYQGRRYHADPPNPPGHWANPFDHGVLTPSASGTVIFSDGSGNRATFAADQRPGVPTIPPCD